MITKKPNYKSLKNRKFLNKILKQTKNVFVMVANRKRFLNQKFKTFTIDQKEIIV